MILVTGKDTGMPAYIWEREIEKIEAISEKGRARPRSFTRVHLKNPKENQEYFLDVKESPAEISRRLKEDKLDPGCETRGMSER